MLLVSGWKWYKSNDAKVQSSYKDAARYLNCVDCRFLHTCYAKTSVSFVLKGIIIIITLLFSHRCIQPIYFRCIEIYNNRLIAGKNFVANVFLFPHPWKDRFKKLKFLFHLQYSFLRQISPSFMVLRVSENTPFFPILSRQFKNHYL